VRRLRAFINALGLLVRDLLQPTNLLAIVVALILAYVGITYVMARFREARLAREREELERTVATLQQDNDRLRAQCEVLKGFVKRLTAESRVAQARVVGHRLDSQKVPLWTFEFVEFGRDGKPFPAKVITLRGEEVWFEALVIRFSDDHVKVGDPLRGRSLHFFRRAWGDAQEPREGPMLAANGSVVPDAYRFSSGAGSTFEQALWLRFWYWANHPDEAKAEGIANVQSHAVGPPRPEPGATYRLTLRHAGGLEIKRIVPQNP